MADEKKLDAALPKIRHFILVMLAPETEDGERLSAMGLMRNFLKAADADAHDLVERLTTNEEMFKIYNTGIEHARAERVEQKPAAPPVAPASQAGMFTEFDDVGYGLNGFSLGRDRGALRGPPGETERLGA